MQKRFDTNCPVGNGREPKWTRGWWIKSNIYPGKTEWDAHTRSCLCGLFSYIYFSLLTVVSILSVICLRVPILSMLLHSPPKYHNRRPASEGQSSPVSDLTPARPFLMWLTTHTKEPQWPAVTEVLGHPLATAGADRGKVSGSGVSEMPHARSSVTWLGRLGWQWTALRA